jgi:hypothetical protein
MPTTTRIPSHRAPMLAIILVGYLMIVLDRHLDRDHRADGDRLGSRILVSWSRLWFEKEPTTHNRLLIPL